MIALLKGVSTDRGYTQEPGKVDYLNIRGQRNDIIPVYLMWHAIHNTLGIRKLNRGVVHLNGAELQAWTDKESTEFAEQNLTLG